MECILNEGAAGTKVGQFWRLGGDPSGLREEVIVDKWGRLRGSHAGEDPEDQAEEFGRHPGAEREATEYLERGTDVLEVF